MFAVLEIALLMGSHADSEASRDVRRERVGTAERKQDGAVFLCCRGRQLCGRDDLAAYLAGGDRPNHGVVRSCDWACENVDRRGRFAMSFVRIRCQDGFTHLLDLINSRRRRTAWRFLEDEEIAAPSVKAPQ